jgi:hypothetical protein
VTRRALTALVVAGTTAALVSCTPSAQNDAADAGPAQNRTSSPRAALELTVPRAVHRATVLPDGRVLLTGGCTQLGCEGFERGRVSEVFDPHAGRFAAGPQMTTPRASHTATLLEDGRVLLTGGYPGEGRPPLASVEVLDPAVGDFVPVGDLSTGRADHTATVLPDGEVLIAGGVSADGQPLATTEVFDPDTNRFRPGPPLSWPRSAHVALPTGDGVVLIGGTADGEVAVATTDVLDGGSWRPGPPLRQARIKHAASVLPNGTVLVVGGASSVEGRDLFATTEIVDLASRSSAAGPALSEGMYKLDGAVAALRDGRVAIAGGQRIDVFDPATGRITVLDAAPVPRRSFVSVSALDDGALLVAGGYDGDVAPTADARVVRVPPAG